MKKGIILAGAIVLFLCIAAFILLYPVFEKQKVVYHINYGDPKQHVVAMRNIKNHINIVGADNLDLKVVLHGKGVSLLQFPDSAANSKLKIDNASDEVQAIISGLKKQGVDFLVCTATLKREKINHQRELYDVDESDLVPSGVAELARLQAKGYTYIKP